VDRIAAARARVQEVRAELRSPAVELPCIKCRHYELVCTHPAVAEIKANPETGKVSSKPMMADKARAETGACGPEGALFDARSPFGLAVVTAFSTKWGWWASFIGLAIIADSLLR
jgi:hypothetical protein